MLFNSYIFILFFLPFCILGYFTLNHFEKYTLAQIFLVGMSLWFYGYFNPGYLLILTASVLLNYVFYLLIRRNRGNKYAKILMISGVLLNIGILLYFKYMDFFIDNINGIFKTDIPFLYIVLPLGISFFTFQQISFLVDTYRGELDGVSFIDYALFVSFFPQLIAGPIVVHEEMIPQFNRIGNDNRSKEEKVEIFTKGVYVFVLGLAKKVLIADTFGIAVDLAYSNVNAINGFESLIVILFYSLQLYFDFSGYCDMAKGIAGMFGMRIANNFNSPYKAINIVDFWKRWHITLSRFFTKNIYIPLGGNRRGEGRMYLNYLIVFFLSGLWHGAGWNFILWGMMHGVLYVITKWWSARKRTRVIKKDTTYTDVYVFSGTFTNSVKTKLFYIIACLLTFIYVSIAWVYFRASDVAQANTLLMNIFTKEWALPGSGFAEAFNLGEFWYVLKILKVAVLPYAEYYIMILFSVFAIAITFFGKNIDELTEKFKPTVVSAVVTAVLFVWCVVSLSGVSTFLYFNF